MKSIKSIRTRVFSGIHISILAAGLLTLVVVLAGLLFRGIEDYDIWFHLKTGEDMITTGSFVYADSYSHTRLGQPWIAHSWLAEIIFHLSDRAAGLTGVVVVKTMMGLTLFFLLAGHIQRQAKNLSLTVVLLLWCLFLNLSFWPDRPYVFTYVLSLILYLALNRPPLTGRGRLALVLMFILWANLHIGFVLGIIIYCLYLVERWLNRDLSRADIILLLALVLAGLLTPYGVDLYWYPVKMFSFSKLTMIREWKPALTYRFLEKPLELMSILLAGIVGFRLVQIKKYFPGLVAVLAVLMSLKAVRYIPFAGIFGAVAVAAALTGIGIGKKTIITWMLNAAIIAIIGLFAWKTDVRNPWGYIFWRYAFQPGINDNLPEGAVQFINQRGIKPNLYNQLHWGGYLIYRLGRSCPVFIDGRMDLYYDLYADDISIRAAAPGYQGLLDRYGINTILLSRFGTLPLRDELSRLGTWPCRVPNQWSLVYEDHNALLFIRQ